MLIVGDIEIDLASQQVTSRGEPVHLTPTEFALLRELAINRGKLLTHAHLLRRVWGQGYETETEYVRVYVRRLRAKLEADGGPPLILTQPRAGYRMRAGVTWRGTVHSAARSWILLTGFLRYGQMLMAV